MDDAYRLIFSVKDGAYRLRSMERVKMRVPPAAERDSTGHAGHFVELRDAGGEALYQRPVATPETLRLEYPTGDPDRPLARAETAAPAMMSVLVPAAAAGRSVALVEAAPAVTAAEAALEESAVPARRDLISIELPRAGEADDGR